MKVVFASDQFQSLLHVTAICCKLRFGLIVGFKLAFCPSWRDWSAQYSGQSGFCIWGSCFVWECLSPVNLTAWHAVKILACGSEHMQIVTPNPLYFSHRVRQRHCPPLVIRFPHWSKNPMSFTVGFWSLVIHSCSFIRWLSAGW